MADKKFGCVKIGCLVSVICLAIGVMLYFQIINQVEKAMYPEPPPLPAVAKQPLPELLRELETVMQANLPEEQLRFNPGLTDDEIAAQEARLGFELPEPLRELYRWHNGYDNSQASDLEVRGPIPGHTFLPLAHAADTTISQREELPTDIPIFGRMLNAAIGYRLRSLPIFVDPTGDGWYYDPERELSGGAIYYNELDTQTHYFYPSVANLINHIVAAYEQKAYTWDPQSQTRLHKAAPDLEEAIMQEFAASASPME